MKQLVIILLMIFNLSLFSQKVKTETTYKFEIKGQTETKIKVSEKTYDGKGNKIKDISFDDDGNINKTKIYVFDDSNNLIEEKILDKKGKTQKITKYEYKNANKIRKTVIDANGSIKSKKEYTYTFY